MLTLQDIELFLDLLRKAAIGVVDFDEAIIGQDGYGFVFRDTACPDGIITSEFSHLRYPLGHFRYNNRIKAMLIPTNRIIRYIGAVKTLVYKPYTNFEILLWPMFFFGRSQTEYGNKQFKRKVELWVRFYF